MKKTTHYRILILPNANDLEVLVNGYLDLGYVLVGGVSMVYRPREQEPFMFSQAVMKEDA